MASSFFVRLVGDDDVPSLGDNKRGRRANDNTKPHREASPAKKRAKRDTRAKEKDADDEDGALDRRYKKKTTRTAMRKT
jgi:hypothetical protein